MANQSFGSFLACQSTQEVSKNESTGTALWFPRGPCLVKVAKKVDVVCPEPVVYTSRVYFEYPHFGFSFWCFFHGRGEQASE